MCNSLPAFPTIESSIGHLQTRHNLVNHAITIYLKDWIDWDVDTKEVLISEQLIHFVEPNGKIAGLKVFSGVSNESA